MHIALKEAEKSAALGEIPVGAAVIDSKGACISTGHNLVMQYSNQVLHAEIVALQKASVLLRRKVLSDCSIYVTLEPCPMCAQAISYYRIQNLYFATEDIKSGGVLNGPQIYKYSHHKPNIYHGFMKDKCKTLLVEFFKNIRNIK
jgi:tRNA(Arg) A34 adenosine deaminase TadA